MPRRMLAETNAASCGWFPVRTFTQNEPLTDAELDRLGDFLKSCKGGRAMNVEALDGFFAALIAGSETVMPSEYNREVFRGEMSETCEFASLDEGNLGSHDAALEHYRGDAAQGVNDMVEIAVCVPVQND
jgi:hypothetical protein